ncbi:phosphoribosylanthranilate isomerase [Commensalibacter sp. Nvir]|uniref:phosphoribosylanthranilate isomerase n=1 Tax=Commensalibacter sp. Nvir TaxID=3069817 RepID=UPI0030C7A461
MIAIKVCGIKEENHYELLAKLNVDWVGLVFYPPSPRYITPEQASHLPDFKQQGLQRVGLFVHPDEEEIETVLEKVRLDVLQLYTSLEQACFIRKRFNIPVWLSKGIKRFSDLPTSCPLDGLVIEAPASKTDTRPGGNSKQFDWRITQSWRAPKPWVLAGGLNCRNVDRAISLSGTRAVDVSSGVENQLGIKDSQLIQNFVTKVRNCNDLNCL